ncbi:MAG: prepilin-type N-terminal cleavage/methylation domain-containing protein [Phycisphaerales bacterium]
MTNQCQYSHQRAFTLIETVISLSIMSVILLGLSSAVFISTKSIPTSTQLGIKDEQVIDAINMFRIDCRQSSQISFEIESNEIHLHLTIDDRGVPATPDEIHYHYRIDDQTFTRKLKGSEFANEDIILFDNIQAGAFVISDDGANATSLWFMLSVDDTILQIYETHIPLPNKPALDRK